MTDFFEVLSQVTFTSFYIFFGTIVLFYLIKVVLISRISHLSHKTETELDDLAIALVKKTNWVTGVAFAIFLAVHFESSLEKVVLVQAVFIVVLTWQVARLFGVVFKYVRKATDDTSGTNVISAFGGILQIVIWVIGILVLVSNLGYDVSSILAGLGIGGLAVALAVKDVLSDIFSSLSIYLDKTFKPGDYISAGDGKEGVVERIGLKTTRIRTSRGELLIMSNRKLTDAAIHNFGELNRRQVVDTLVLPFKTSQKKVESFSDGCCAVFDTVSNVEFVRAHLKKLSVSELTYELVYYVNSANYKEYTDAQNEINQKLKVFLEKQILG